MLVAYSLFAKIPDLKATTGRIFDGDTFAAVVHLEGGASVRANIRFIDIDAPELSGECESEIEWAYKSKARLEELLPEGTKVTLSGIKDDKYLGRINAYVRLPDGRDVSQIMLAENMAVAYTGGKRSTWCTDEEIEQWKQRNKQ